MLIRLEQALLQSNDFNQVHLTSWSLKKIPSSLYILQYIVLAITLVSDKSSTRADTKLLKGVDCYEYLAPIPQEAYESWENGDKMGS